MGAHTVSSDEEEGFGEREDGVNLEDDEEEDEEDEEGQDEYEKDDFIVDDVEEEEDEEEAKSDDEVRARRKKRKKRDTEEQYELDEDDYELLQEANVTGFHRPKSSSKSKFKRLKKAGRVGEEDELNSQRGFSDDEDLDEGERRGRTAEEELKRSLFGDDEVALPEDIGEEEELAEEEEDIGEEDEMADFIVDEEEMDENGQPVRHRKAKKRGPRPATGISSIALQEAQEIFGDVEELLNRRKLGLRIDKGEGEEDIDLDEEGFGRPSKKKLEEEFEPSILEEKYMTAKDDRIRERDMPERFQLLESMVGAIPTKESKVKEAQWIYKWAFKSSVKEFEYLKDMDEAKVFQQIGYVLTQLHDNKLEIPFIGMYRKEGCLDLVTEPVQVTGSSKEKNQQKPKLKKYKALWQVQFWDRKWWLLQRRKATLQATYEKRARAEAGKDLVKCDILDTLLLSLKEADSEQAVDDVDAKFHLHFPPDEAESEQGQFKRPKRRSLYSICRKAGLASVAKHFGLTPFEFGENISAMYKKHEVDDSSLTPEDIAKAHCVGEFREPKSVLRGARYMAAVEISAEPMIKEYVRNTYMEKAVVTTKPTAEGNVSIDPFHQYGPVKWLLNKPISSFDDAQWLLIQKAEEEKMLEATVGLPKEVINDTLMLEFETQYLSDGVSRTANLWNEQRRQILNDAILTILLPLMEKEARILLTVRAKNWVAVQCGDRLWTKISVAPYPRPKSDPDEHSDEDGAPRVMACCWGPGKPPITFVMLDPAGEMVNTLSTFYLTSHSRSPEQMQRKKNDQQRLLKFMMENQPHVVVLGAATLACRNLKDDIFEAIFKIVEEHPRDLAEGVDMISVVYGDESLPKLYENSPVSLEQLPGQPGIVRRAIGLGRYLQNPLAMTTSLCGPNREILSLKVHPYQHFLSSDELYDTYEQRLVSVTNQVGIDVNLGACHEWLLAPLQFVCGLGPRKASLIQRSLQGVGRISTRKEMLTSLRLMKKNVFINASGFLRVRGSGQAASGNQIMDPLDDTRIHPESYDLAKKMAEDVYCADQHQNREDMDDELLEMAIEHVKENPNLIKNLDIVEYAGLLYELDNVNKLETLKDIQMELLHGYQDWRVPYAQPSQDEEFSLLTGEDEETLAEGRIVNATVRRVQHNRVTCVLECGLIGVIQKEELSDDREFNPSDKVSGGNIITCRIKGVQKAKYVVDLTCKGSELRSDYWQNQLFRDKYYVQDDSIVANEQLKARKEKEDDKHRSFKPRMIVHPQFQNMSMPDAIEALSDKDAGECIIRPSSKGPTHLSLTLKFFDQVYSHIDIAEGGKDSQDFTGVLRLGKTLTIGNETFEDLDEVIARYVDPLVSNLKTMLTYRKFQAGTKSQVDDFLKQEKLQYPNRIVYCFNISYDHPGSFLMSYIRNTNAHHEYVSLYPKGFKFRKRMFENPDKLVFFFQNHINDPIIDNPPHRAVAAMVPLKSPVAGAVGSGVWGGSERPSSAASTGWADDANRGAGSDRASTPGSRSVGNWGGALGGAKSGHSGWLDSSGRHSNIVEGGGWGGNDTGEDAGQKDAAAGSDTGWERTRENSLDGGWNDGLASWSTGKDVNDDEGIRSNKGSDDGWNTVNGFEGRGWDALGNAIQGKNRNDNDENRNTKGAKSSWDASNGLESGVWQVLGNARQGSGNDSDQNRFRLLGQGGRDSEFRGRRGSWGRGNRTESRGRGRGRWNQDGWGGNNRGMGQRGRWGSDGQRSAGGLFSGQISRNFGGDNNWGAKDWLQNANTEYDGWGVRKEVLRDTWNAGNDDESTGKDERGIQVTSSGWGDERMGLDGRQVTDSYLGHGTRDLRSGNGWSSKGWSQNTEMEDVGWQLSKGGGSRDAWYVASGEETTGKDSDSGWNVQKDIGGWDATEDTRGWDIPKKVSGWG